MLCFAGDGEEAVGVWYPHTAEGETHTRDASAILYVLVCIEHGARAPGDVRPLPGV